MPGGKRRSSDQPTRTQEGVEIPVAYSNPLDQMRAEEEAARLAAFRDEQEKFRAKLEADGIETSELKDDGKYLTGFWNGLPNYGCPYCGYESLGGDAEMALHIEKTHPRNWVAELDLATAKAARAAEVATEQEPEGPIGPGADDGTA